MRKSLHLRQVENLYAVILPGLLTTVRLAKFYFFCCAPFFFGTSPSGTDVLGFLKDDSNEMFTQQINLRNCLTIGMYFLIGIGLCVLYVVVMIVAIPVVTLSRFANLRFDRAYQDYLQTINGTNFFCYNNRANSKDFVEKKLLPLLTPDIKVIYLDGRTPKSEYDQTFISEALYRIKDRKGFPYLLKISDGQLIDQSINNDLYNIMNQNKDIEQLGKKIISFYLTD